MPRLLLPLHVALTGSAAQLDVTSALKTPAQVSHCKKAALVTSVCTCDATGIVPQAAAALSAPLSMTRATATL